MIGTLVGAGLGVAGSIWGGIQASRAARQANAQLDQKERDNQNWFDRRYHEDATQRADAQRMMQIVQDNIRRRNRNAVGTQAVMGATSEGIATEQEAGNQALAQTASSITAQGERRKDAIEGQYQEQKNAIADKRIAIEQGRAGQITKAIGGVLEAGAGIAGAFEPKELDKAQ